MNREEEFERRLALIRGLGTPIPTDRSPIAKTPVDHRHAEFQAMAEVFLGEDFNQRKLRKVEDLQIALHSRMAELCHQYGAKKIEPEEYVASFGTLLGETFRKCEEILGQEDFLKLFGAPRSQLTEFIDKEASLDAH